jgi:hypothetical protein
MDLTNYEYVVGLKSNLNLVFDNPPGQEVFSFLEEIGSWYPKQWDSMETNAIIARDANRRLLGTLRTIMQLEPEQIIALAKEQEK